MQGLLDSIPADTHDAQTHEHIMRNGWTLPFAAAGVMLSPHTPAQDKQGLLGSIHRQVRELVLRTCSTCKLHQMCCMHIMQAAICWIQGLVHGPGRGAQPAQSCVLPCTS